MMFLSNGLHEVARAIRESTHEILYKRVTRKTPISAGEVEQFKKISDEIDKTPMLTDVQKAITRQKMYLDLITVEVERFPQKDGGEALC